MRKTSRGSPNARARDDVGCRPSLQEDNAALQLLAADVLELDGGVADVEVVLEHVIELDQDAGALRRRNVGDGHVAGQGAGVRAEAPDVQVVNVDHALDGFHAGANLGERDAAGRAFEKNIEGLADDADAGPENERGNEQRENRVDPVRPVSRMPAPPAMTAAVESVSPAMWRKAERRFTSRATPHSRAAITPFITTPAAATIIISRGCTATGPRAGGRPRRRSRGR